MNTLTVIIKRKWKELRNRWELHKYDRFTIAEYFRKQGVQIGENCAIIPSSLGAEPYLIKIGNHVTIATGVKFLTHDGGAWLFRHEVPDLQLYGTIVIEDNCVIGENAILLPNTHIGSNTIIGAGSVVISNIPSDSIAIGVPARVISSIHPYREKCLERWQLQRPPDAIIEEGKTWWNSAHLQENVLKLRRHLVKLFWEKDEFDKTGEL